MNKTHQKKILVVLSSHDTLGDSGKPTGWYLSELTHFYHPVTEAGWEIDIMSPQGGAAPMDPISHDLSDPINKTCLEDKVFRSKIENTLKPSEVNPSDYAAVFYPGGHGPMYDLATNKEIAAITRAIYEQGGVVSAVCHGPAGLLPVVLSSGKDLLAGHTVAGFSNLEEYLVRKAKWMPFLLETELKKKAAKYTKGLPSLAHIEVSGRLVTGQNPRSAKPVAEEVLNLLAQNFLQEIF